ncbi:MAG TPA: cytochrome c biogenesis protein CcdA [Bacteroidales bacterium]|nr:cytochrome c biogenesis protein CcdA [Bacteroidales bacterium]
MRASRALFLSTLLLISLSLSAQILEPVKWSFSSKKLSDTEAELVFTATMDPGWHLYSQFLKPGGPIPTAFKFTESPAYRLLGKVKEPKAHTEFDAIFKMDVSYFDGKAEFRQKIQVLSAKDFVVEGTFEYMTCNDETCIPFFDNDFSIPVKAASAGATAEGSAAGQDKKELGPALEMEPVDPATLTDTARETIAEDTDAGVTTAEGAPLAAEDNRSLWAVIIEAILWGFAALLTPCVFPMVPMTVSFFMKSGQDKVKSRLMASTYGFSIVALYTIPIAVIIGITYFVGGKAITADIFNWLSTHWVPNVLFFLIFVLFAASFFGAFEIVLPSWMVNKADAKADRGGLIGTFFMALTLVLVSFSCTGPIIGSIMVKSTHGEVWEPVITMFAFSVAFALPFTLFAFFPRWLNNMPKSGGWLNAVKVTLGFIELALGLKFLSVADQTYHWGILDREIYIAFWIVIALLMGMYFIGKLRFAHDSEMKHVPVPRLFLGILAFTFAIYLVPGMFGAPLKALSGYLPPQSTHDFDLNAIIRDNAEVVMSTGSGSGTVGQQLCDEPRYGDFLHLPHGLKGYFDYEQGLACAKEQNKPIFIDFTGHGCVNCREMEANVWSHPEVLKRLRNDYLVIALYVDDKTTLPEEEWITSAYDGKVKKTVGRKYADFQISRFNTNAQPYYCLLDHEGQLLVQPRAYDLDVEAFIQFLDEGLAEFQRRQGNP